MMKSLRLGGACSVLAASLASGLFSVAHAGAIVSDSEIAHIARTEYGRVHFSNLGDRRRKSELGLYSINEYGIITVEEMKKAIQSETLPHSDSLLAVFVLNRILDHRSMQLKFDPKVSEERVNYIVRSLLIYNGMSLGKLKTKQVPVETRTLNGNPVSNACGEPGDGKALDEDISQRSEEEMFGWLRSLVDGFVKSETERLARLGTEGKLQAMKEAMHPSADYQPLIMTAYWNAGEEIGVGGLLDVIRSNLDHGWPRNGNETKAERDPVYGKCKTLIAREDVPVDLRIPVNRFPETLDGFRQLIRSELESMYAKYRRQAAWESIQAMPKMQGKSFNQVAYQLFRLNRFEYSQRSCKSELMCFSSRGKPRYADPAALASSISEFDLEAFVMNLSNEAR